MWSMGGGEAGAVAVGGGGMGVGSSMAPPTPFMGRPSISATPVHTVLITRIARVINLSEILLKLLQPRSAARLSH